MTHDLRLATLVARLRFRVVRAPLPDAGDVHGQALYWKRYYNTYLGAGTVAEYLRNHRRLVCGG
jgi:hypothetical protein